MFRLQRRFAHRSVKSIYDFRSDTVTRPTPQMYEAMLNASTDDDVMQVGRSYVYLIMD
jgi:hypothetical protein